MTRILFITAAVLATAGAASAQPYTQQPFQPGPFYQSPTVQPNIFNPQNQPLSPYLNLLNNGTGSAASRYYYGVRPGTVGGTGLGLGAPFTAPGGYRPPFFPQLAYGDPTEPRDPDSNHVLAPAGHPVVFNNTLGYFPSPFGNRGGMRTGLAGLGAGGSGAPAQQRK